MCRSKKNCLFGLCVCESGVASLYETVIAAGDRDQRLNAGGSAKECKDGQPLHLATQPMRTCDIMARMARNKKEGQMINNRQTSRFGEPHLTFLKRIFFFFNDVETRAEHPTYFYPVFFTFTKALCTWDNNKHGQIHREASIFVTSLMMIALECVINWRSPRRQSIAVICYLSIVVEDLKAYLSSHLEEICGYWHQLLFPHIKMPSYHIDALRTTLKLAVLGPYEAKGKTADVVFVLGMLRQHNDLFYRGLMSEKQMVGMHYTRARHRLYTFIHDAFPDLSTPPEEEYSRKRPRGHTEKETRTDQILEKKINESFYNEIRSISRENWTSLDTDNYAIGYKGQNECTFRHGLKELPFFGDEEYRNNLQSYLNKFDVDDQPDFLSRDTWNTILRKCLFTWEDMDVKNKWPNRKGRKREEPEAEDKINDAGWWKNHMQNDPQCNKQMINDDRRNEDVCAMRTEKQFAEEGDKEEFIRPPEAVVFNAWRHFMLTCSSISLHTQEQYTICLPFSTLIHYASYADNNPMPEEVTLRESAGWLARALAMKTESLFQAKGVLVFFILLIITDNICGGAPNLP